MIKLLKRVRLSSRAATAIEYGLIMGLIALACVGAFSAFGGKSSAMWNNIQSNALANL
jgi:pilus assembly protein Flp/PilA